MAVLFDSFAEGEWVKYGSITLYLGSDMQSALIIT